MMTPAWQLLVLAIFVVVLAGCVVVLVPEPVTLSEPPIAGPDHSVLRDPSLTSRALMAHYTTLQTQMLTQNLLRSDGGVGDMPFTDMMLVCNFAQIALVTEYADNSSFSVC